MSYPCIIELIVEVSQSNYSSAIDLCEDVAGVFLIASEQSGFLGRCSKQHLCNGESRSVEQWAARIPRIDGCVRLHGVWNDVCAIDDHAPSKRADDSGGARSDRSRLRAPLSGTPRGSRKANVGVKARWFFPFFFRRRSISLTDHMTAHHH